jgi:murein DD-endopeptidase MepM/ murein hydrolase activator NlpD
MMSKISNLIFKGKPHYITQGFSNHHNGTDYGTYRKKIPQYAIENGVIRYVGVDKYGSKYVMINYPRINKTFLHGHFAKIFVRTGQSVDSNTVLGLTGMTGKATGIHLHLTIIDNNTKADLDPELYAKEYADEDTTNQVNVTDNKTYYTVVKGDNLTKIGKKYGYTWQSIYQNNKDIIGNNPNRIYPGMRLIIK